MRSVDPMRAWRSILTNEEVRIEEAFDAIERGGEPETTNTLKAICLAFGVSRYDETTQAGLTDGELLAILDDFSDYVSNTKKKTSTSPTWRARTGLESSGDWTTRQPLDSSSMPNGSKRAKQPA